MRIEAASQPRSVDSAHGCADRPPGRCEWLESDCSFPAARMGWWRLQPLRGLPRAAPASPIWHSLCRIARACALQSLVACSVLSLPASPLHRIAALLWAVCGSVLAWATQGGQRTVRGHWLARLHVLRCAHVQLATGCDGRPFRAQGMHVAVTVGLTPGVGRDMC
jgi:hypothetical protein